MLLISPFRTQMNLCAKFMPFLLMEIFLYDDPASSIFSSTFSMSVSRPDGGLSSPTHNSSAHLNAAWLTEVQQEGSHSRPLYKLASKIQNRTALISGIQASNRDSNCHHVFKKNFTYRVYLGRPWLNLT